MKEMSAIGNRLFDVKKLDEIAKTAPREYAWRPKVCYGKHGAYKMADYDGQVIRCGSSLTGLGDTHYGRSDDRDLIRLLRCDPQPSAGRSAGRSSSRAQKPSAGHNQADSFHQELIPSLEEWGEIYVFFVGSRILYTCCNRGEYADNWTCMRLNSVKCFKGEGGFAGLTDAEAMAMGRRLNDFSEYWREELLRSGPEGFASVKVAVRLDIGISKPGPDGKFLSTG